MTMEVEQESRLGQFVRRALIGGLLIMLPLAIISFFFRWVYQTLSGAISPFTQVFVNSFGFPQFVADMLVLLLLVLICFAIGTMAGTRLGSWSWRWLDGRVMAHVPGYRTVREITSQLLGENHDSPFKKGEVARVWLYGRDLDVSVTALLTSRHPDGRLTVFVPTGPNPTSGFIYHVDPALVELRPDIGVDQLMKSVLSCGAGSGAMWQGGLRQAAAQQED